MLLSKHFHSSLDILKNNVSDMKFPSLVITNGGTATQPKLKNKAAAVHYSEFVHLLFLQDGEPSGKKRALKWKIGVENDWK